MRLPLKASETRSKIEPRAIGPAKKSKEGETVEGFYLLLIHLSDYPLSVLFSCFPDYVQSAVSIFSIPAKSTLSSAHSKSHRVFLGTIRGDT